jgi:hypothetical protein
MARQRAASSRTALVSADMERWIAATMGLYKRKPRHVNSIVSALHNLSTRSCVVKELVSSDKLAVNAWNSHALRRGSRCDAMNLPRCAHVAVSQVVSIYKPRDAPHACERTPQ